MSSPSSPDLSTSLHDVAVGRRTEPRLTLAREVSVEGAGIHSGALCRLRLNPAPSGTGILFTRGKQRVPATVAAADAEASDRRTVIAAPDGERFEQIEHLMAALAALGICDVVAEQTGPEVPFLDGGSRDYMRALREAGSTPSGGDRAVLEVLSPVSFEDGNAWFTATPHEGLRLSCFVEFPGTIVGNAGFTLEIDADSFEREAAPARTFALASDIEKLRAAG